MNRTQKVTAGAVVAVLAGLVALAVPAFAGGFAGAADAEPVATAGAVQPSSALVTGDDKAVWDAMPYGHSDHAELEKAWTRAIAAWPLPVPESYPFPADIPLHALNEYDYYSGRLAAQYANFWWMCGASQAVVDARTAGDAAAEQYWVDALDWWGKSETRAITFGDSGGGVSGRAAETAASSDCTSIV